MGKNLEDLRTAIIICNYNMPEYTDQLAEHIFDTVKLPYDLIIVDNGSDIARPSKYSSHVLYKNIQMVPGFLYGFRQADFYEEYINNDEYFAYWTLTTSCRFNRMDKRDPLRELLTPLYEDPKSFAIQPSLITNFGAWRDYLWPRPAKTPRKVWGLDAVCELWRAEPFNEFGRWREELTYGWGFMGELHYLARKAGLNIYTHDGYVMYHDTQIGYQMDRMNMSAEERGELADKQSEEIYTELYGPNWREVFQQFITPDMK